MQNNKSLLTYTIIATSLIMFAMIYGQITSPSIEQQLDPPAGGLDPTDSIISFFIYIIGFCIAVTTTITAASRKRALRKNQTEIETRDINLQVAHFLSIALLFTPFICWYMA